MGIATCLAPGGYGPVAAALVACFVAGAILAASHKSDGEGYHERSKVIGGCPQERNDEGGSQPCRDGVHCVEDSDGTIRGT